MSRRAYRLLPTESTTFHPRWMGTHGAVASNSNLSVAAGAEMHTGIVDVDDFWRAHLTHVLINDEQEPGSDRLIGSVHTWIVRTGRHTILIDSCIGNDKERPTRPQFHRLRSGYLADLRQAGVGVEDIDFVMCTHLHWDHVGWNTRLDNGVAAEGQ